MTRLHWLDPFNGDEARSTDESALGQVDAVRLGPSVAVTSSTWTAWLASGTEPPPLRFRQRDDGNGVGEGHGRIGGTRSVRGGIRVDGRGTYS